MVSRYKVVLGWTTLRLAPFAWHGIDTTERNNEKQDVHKNQRGGKMKIGESLTSPDKDFRKGMENQM